MSEYTPTEARICIDFCNAATKRAQPDGSFLTMEQADAAFSRWLAAHDAEVRAEFESDPAKDERLVRYMAMATPLGYLSALTVVQQMTALIEAETRARAAGVVAEEPEGAWQWCYVEKWADDSGVYERVTFDAEAKARRYLRDNVERVEGLNQEFEADGQIIASIEKRRTFEPGEWVPVKQEGADTDES